MFSVVYHPEAREEATALPVKIRVKFDRLIGKLEYDARLLREPDTKPLGDGIFEIRTMGTDSQRHLGIPQRQYHHHAPGFHQEVSENASKRNRSRQKAVNGGT
jgi:mRNA-degrading endonuclease RelE of RelBE toxin-antitoxin system